jgi:hypothetical protein
LKLKPRPSVAGIDTHAVSDGVIRSETDVFLFGVL